MTFATPKTAAKLELSLTTNQPVSKAPTVKYTVETSLGFSNLCWSQRSSHIEN